MTTAPALDPLMPHLVTERLLDRMADSVEAPIDEVAKHVRTTHLSFKLLCEVEARNQRLAAVETAQAWTRLATMAPFHPDDQALLEDSMARHRRVVLAQGRRAAYLELGHDPDA